MPVGCQRGRFGLLWLVTNLAAKCIALTSPSKFYLNWLWTQHLVLFAKGAEEGPREQGSVHKGERA